MLAGTVEQLFLGSQLRTPYPPTLVCNLYTIDKHQNMCHTFNTLVGMTTNQRTPTAVHLLQGAGHQHQGTGVDDLSSNRLSSELTANSKTWCRLKQSRPPTLTKSEAWGQKPVAHTFDLTHSPYGSLVHQQRTGTKPTRLFFCRFFLAQKKPTSPSREAQTPPTDAQRGR